MNLSGAYAPGTEVPWRARRLVAGALIGAALADALARARAERPHLAPGGRALLAAAAFGGGAAANLAAPDPVPTSVWVIVAALAALAWAVMRRGGFDLRLVGLAALMAWMAAGAVALDLRADRVVAARVAEDGVEARVTGWVERRDLARDGRLRVTLRVSEYRARGAEGDGPIVPDAPRRVRVTLARPGPPLGASVVGDFALRPPPPAAAPGGYDFARRAWFSGIGGVGWSLGPVTTVEPAALSTREAWDIRIARWRGALSTRLAAADGTQGGVLAALVTGDRSHITPDAEAILRDSGLAHILSISGSHMALVAGGAYAALAWLLAAITPFARARDVRRPAAAAALGVASVYLLVSGGDVTAVRAYVMAAIALVAIMAGRRGVTLHAVAVAAIVVLAAAPESAVEPGFQLSFTATAALVAAFEAAGRRRRAQGGDIGAHPVVRLLRGDASASLVAGAAMAPIGVYFFQRITTYGLVANVLAMPVFSFWVMPATALAGVLAPFGLEAWPAAFAARGLDVVAWIAARAAEAPGAVRYAAAPSAEAYLLAMAGVLAACALAAGRWRWLTVCGAGALALHTVTPRAQVWIAPGEIVAFAEGGAAGVWGAEANAYAPSQFLARAGIDPDAPSPHPDWACDRTGCVTRVHGRLLALPRTPGALLEDCAEAEIVLLPYRPPPRLAARCPEGRLHVLAPLGPAGVLVTVTPAGEVRVRRARPAARPWSALTRSGG